MFHQFFIVMIQRLSRILESNILYNTFVEKLNFYYFLFPF